MSAKYFLDTNIFIYAFSPADTAKRSRASQLIQEGLESGSGIISGQVFQEFINAALHKPSTAVPRQILDEYVDHVLRPLCRVQSSVPLYQQALEIHRVTQYRFYDSLIVAAALESGANILYSEDLQHGRQIAHLRITNPFAK